MVFIAGMSVDAAQTFVAHKIEKGTAGEDQDNTQDATSERRRGTVANGAVQFVREYRSLVA